MKMAKSWCCLFTTGAAVIGGGIYTTLAAGAICKQKFLEKTLAQFDGNFHLPSFNVTASMAPGMPVMPLVLGNITGAAKQFLTPSLLETLNDMAADVGNGCMAVTGEQWAMVMALLVVAGGFIFQQGQINDLQEDQEPIMPNRSANGYSRL